MRKKILSSLALLGGGIAIVATTLVSNYFIMAWTEPTLPPPGGTPSGLVVDWNNINNKPAGLDDGDDFVLDDKILTSGEFRSDGNGDCFLVGGTGAVTGEGLSGNSEEYCVVEVHCLAGYTPLSSSCRHFGTEESCGAYIIDDHVECQTNAINFNIVHFNCQSVCVR